MPHIEEMMIAFLARLLGHPPTSDGPARQVFRALKSEEARIQVLRALLENAHINLEKPQIYDEVIEGFAAVKNTRNDFAHDLWFTHESGRVYLAPCSTDMEPWIHQTKRRVTLPELEFNLKRIEELAKKIRDAVEWVDSKPIALGMRRFRIKLTTKKDQAPEAGVKPPKERP
jgi:hypothetical protein